MLFKRSILHDIEKVLEREEFIILTGARQTGKTSILMLLKDYLEKKGNTCNYFNLENPDHLKKLNDHPFNIFDLLPSKQVKQYVFVDEIQYLNNPTNFLKLLYDERRSMVKIIASGSSAFYIDEKFKDSLVGRKLLFEVFPLNFNEFLEFKNETELLDKKSQKLTEYYKHKLLEFWNEYLIYGGYPKVVLAENDEIRKMLLDEIVSAYVKKDIFDAGIKNTDKYFSLLKILASQTGGLLNSQELANTLKIAHKTVDEYLYVVQKSYQAAFIRPFSGNVRKELTKMPKVYFYDLGFRNFLLNNFNKLPDRPDKGVYLENIIFREFLKEHHGSEGIKFWRTQDKKEVDFIINESDAYEVKYNSNEIKAKKYEQFKLLYPKIKFRFLTYSDILPKFYKWQITE